MRVRYPPNALEALWRVEQYLSRRFSSREVDVLYDLMGKFEDTVSVAPETYPIDPRKSLARRAVIHHRMIFVYEINDDEIIVTDAWDTRQDR